MLIVEKEWEIPVWCTELIFMENMKLVLKTFAVIWSAREKTLIGPVGLCYQIIIVVMLPKR